MTRLLQLMDFIVIFLILSYIFYFLSLVQVLHLGDRKHICGTPHPFPFAVLHSLWAFHTRRPSDDDSTLSRPERMDVVAFSNLKMEKQRSKHIWWMAVTWFPSVSDLNSVMALTMAITVGCWLSGCFVSQPPCETGSQRQDMRRFQAGLFWSLDRWACLSKLSKVLPKIDQVVEIGQIARKWKTSTWNLPSGFWQYRMRGICQRRTKIWPSKLELYSYGPNFGRSFQLDPYLKSSQSTKIWILVFVKYPNFSKQWSQVRLPRSQVLCGEKGVPGAIIRMRFSNIGPTQPHLYPRLPPYGSWESKNSS